MLLAIFLHVVALRFCPAFSVEDSVSRNERSDEYIPCERGWYYFRDKCYKVVGRKMSDRVTWDRALARCKSWGSDLVSIQSQEEQDFVVSFLQLDIVYWIWIGLNDRENETDYKWSDGSVFNYTNWKKGEPAGFRDETEDCVHMVMEPTVNVGKWNDRACDATEGYVCEKNANQRRSSPNPMYCSSEEGGGWKYKTSCYHIIEEMKSWQDAERHCKITYNGHLLTIHDTLEDVFLDYITNMGKELWIGIKVQNHLQQKWTSGWFVSYNGFENESNLAKGTCVARKNSKEWLTIPCSKQLPFICEISQAIPPVLKQPPAGSHCPTDFDDWRDLGGEYCYYIEATKSLYFHDALFECKRKGGDLASLHSREEAEILLPFVQYRYIDDALMRTVFIGLLRRYQHEEIFAWTDGSAFNYQDWAHNEPNNEEELCGETWTNDFISDRGKMKWNDCICNQKRGYICSVKKITSDTSAIEDKDCTSFCIAPTSYLHGVISQCEEAKKIN